MLSPTLRWFDRGKLPGKLLCTPAKGFAYEFAYDLIHICNNFVLLIKEVFENEQES